MDKNIAKRSLNRGDAKKKLVLLRMWYTRQRMKKKCGTKPKEPNEQEGFKQIAA